jgi:hypothetical protein
MDARSLAAQSIAVALALSAQSACAGALLDFDRTFNDSREPARSHYVATYRLADGEHRVEVWRDRNLRLKRHTDEAIETYVDRPLGKTEWSMVVLDLKRRIRTDIDRTNLYRIGHFIDWFSLSHSLSRPTGPYELAILPQNAQPPVAPIGACRWYLLTQGSRTNKICWSAAQGAAFVITDGNDAVRWMLSAIDSHALPAATFAIDDRDFVRNNANEDIEAD